MVLGDAPGDVMSWRQKFSCATTGFDKRVRSSSGRSQDCVRLGTSRDKSCFDLLELSFSTVTVF